MGLEQFLELDFELPASLFLADTLVLIVLLACFGHGCVHLERAEIEPTWQHDDHDGEAFCISPSQDL